MPATFPFPSGDQRLRAITASGISPFNRYVPFITALDTSANNYGDAAAFLAFNTGSAKNGKILYVWTTLLSSPQGQSIMGDVVTWILNATLQPPPPKFNSFIVPDANHAAFAFDLRSNLDYVVQYRSGLNSGVWTPLKDFSSAPANRSLWYTNDTGGAGSRFYRQLVGP